ncbi:DUF4350 domain-containing protein [Nocardiopsis composta]|uniref:DUF4350 domain-containing protein n=1 Tax=Nocardiopsis composta TaxID=157465 RepID=A0A7W8VDU1_9ACTN|nr:DUF4350 domain-containing protein [Nocardiopsis composta]MBB5432851.1 hypothetical protein [Nocardiopsis composta]
MSAGIAPPPAAPPAAPPGPGALLRRHRGTIAFIAVLVLLGILVSLGQRPERSGRLEPESAAPEGSRALVNVVRDRGGEVTVVRGTDAAVQAADAGALVVLPASHRLGRAELDRLAASPADLLLVQPTGPALEALAPGVQVAGRTDQGALEPDCALPAARAAGPADLGGETYTGAPGCYPADGGSALVGTDRPGGAVSTVIGTPAPLTNERLGREGNAALLLNLIGDRDVVWFLPDVPVEQGSEDLVDLLPPAVRLSVFPLAAALLLLAFWQGRRLGPLVAERLPVVVRAAETTEGRARLYASRRARDRSALALRTGTAERLRPRLGLAADAPPTEVADAAARRTGDDPGRLRELLYGVAGDGSDITDDTALVRLAAELDRLEERIR